MKYGEFSGMGIDREVFSKTPAAEVEQLKRKVDFEKELNVWLKNDMYRYCQYVQDYGAQVVALKTENKQLKADNEDLKNKLARDPVVVDEDLIIDCRWESHFKNFREENEQLKAEVEQLKAENQELKKELNSYKTMRGFAEEVSAKMAKNLNKDKKEKEFEKGGFIPGGCCGPKINTGEVILRPEQLNELRTKGLENTILELKKENEMLKETIREHIDI